MTQNHRKFWLITHVFRGGVYYPTYPPLKNASETKIQEGKPMGKVRELKEVSYNSTYNYMSNKLLQKQK